MSGQIEPGHEPMSAVAGAGMPPVMYAGCPACALVTPLAWVRRPSTGDDPDQTVMACCACCGDVHRVIAPDRVLTDLSRQITHGCGAVVSFPQEAGVVRCSTRGPAVTTDSGCGALFRVTPQRPPPDTATNQHTVLRPRPGT